MAFFKDTQDQQVVDWSTKFRRALSERKMLTQSALLRTVEHFRSLKKEKSAEQIESVLSWYCKHAGEEYVPRVCSAKMFRSRFDELIRAMGRDVEAESDEVDEVAKDTAKRWLNAVSWPVEIQSALPAIIARSRKNWASFRVRLGKILGQDSTFCTVLLLRHVSFVETWIAFLQEQHGWKEHYLGAPMELAFDPESKRFKESFWRRWSSDWCGDPKRFDKLLEELNNAN